MYGDIIGQAIRALFCIAALLIVVAFVIAFFVGRCSAGYAIKLQSPIKAQELKTQ